MESSRVNDILESAKLAPETDTCKYYFGVIKETKVKKEISHATLWAEWVATHQLFLCVVVISIYEDVSG